MDKERAHYRRRASYAPRLIIMAKSPRAGRIKLRLAANIGAVPATRFYRTCLAHTLIRLGGDRRWHTLLAVSPGNDIGMRLWLTAGHDARIGRLSQCDGDLGRRMQLLFQRLPPGPAIIVGSDIPAINPSEIAKAFRLLSKSDAVFGPASDGGYWLVGLRRSPSLPAPFTQVRWSGPYALADTLDNLKRQRVAFAATLNDVDTEGDYRRLGRHWERLIPPAR